MHKNRVIRGLVALIASACASLSAQASTPTGPAVPSFLTYHANGVVWVYFLTSIRSGTVPACAGTAGTYYRLVFDSTTAAGKAMLAGLIAAHASGDAVWPFGTGDCGVDGVNETLSSFEINS